MQSQYYYNDGHIKSRLVKKDLDWYVWEWKYASDRNTEGKKNITGRLVEGGEEGNFWWPCAGGTAEYFGLSDQEKAWAAK